MKHYFHRYQNLFHKFRIYDCLDRGYVIMTEGKVIGTADTLVQAERKCKNYV